MRFQALIITSFTLIPLSLHAQPDFVWGKQFGTSQEEYVMNHVADNCGYLYIGGKTSGSFNGANRGKNDAFIVKVDGEGNLVWQRQFGSSGDEDEQWCAIDPTGDIYVTGSTTGNLNGVNRGREDVFVTKFSSEGHLLWTVQCGTDSTDVGQSVVAEGEFIYVTGTTSGAFGKNNPGKSDCFLMKLNKSGEIIFIKQFGTDADDFATSISLFDNTIFICGNTWGDLGGKNAGFIDCFTSEFDLSGNPLISHQFGTPGFDIAMNILAEADGMYVCGSTSDNLGAEQLGEGDAFLLKMKQTGEIIWKSQFGTNLHDGARCIAANSKFPDLVLVSGLQHLAPAQGFIRAFKKDGTFLWEHTVTDIYGEMNSSGKSVILHDSGIITHIGLTSSEIFDPLIGVTDFYIAGYQLR
ncbi:MAG TPA: SBBP repeat-containing protein [Bacteroidales bacterium]|nr:SBBP repeat-containing protein [Bacteroidales bacterium]